MRQEKIIKSIIYKIIFGKKINQLNICVKRLLEDNGNGLKVIVSIMFLRFLSVYTVCGIGIYEFAIIVLYYSSHKHWPSEIGNVIYCTKKY